MGPPIGALLALEVGILRIVERLVLAIVISSAVRAIPSGLPAGMTFPPVIDS